jgi:hypothetical protein
MGLGIVFLPVLFNTMMPDTNEVMKENEIPDKKTLVFSENVLILEEDKKQSGEIIN